MSNIGLLTVKAQEVLKVIDKPVPTLMPKVSYPASAARADAAVDMIDEA
jgi:hypothetical protein